MSEINFGIKGEEENKQQQQHKIVIVFVINHVIVLISLAFCFLIVNIICGWGGRGMRKNKNERA